MGARRVGDRLRFTPTPTPPRDPYPRCNPPPAREQRIYHGDMLALLRGDRQLDVVLDSVMRDADAVEIHGGDIGPE